MPLEQPPINTKKITYYVLRLNQYTFVFYIVYTLPYIECFEKTFALGAIVFHFSNPKFL